MLYRMGAYEEAVSAYESHRKDMAGNARKLFEYGHTLHRLDRHAASSEVLKKALKVSSDPMVLNIIGKNCQAQGQPKEAEHWFIRSTRRLPNRIYPYYLLAKLYAEHPEMFPKEKLEWAVRMVQEKEAKVESTAIREMREEVKELLKDKRE
jgi:tetratricopeptide (TPR) repeat protein